MTDTITRTDPLGIQRMTGILAFLANEDTHVNGAHRVERFPDLW